MARISATETGLSTLQLEANGQLINVPIRDAMDVGTGSSYTTSSSSSSFGKSGKVKRGNDDIIEAEIIDKESK